MLASVVFSCHGWSRNCSYSVQYLSDACSCVDSVVVGLFGVLVVGVDVVVVVAGVFVLRFVGVDVVVVGLVVDRVVWEIVTLVTIGTLQQWIVITASFSEIICITTRIKPSYIF